MALNESVAERERRSHAEDRILAEHAWDAIAENMNTLMEQAYARKQRFAESARLYPAGPRVKGRPAIKPAIATTAAQSAKEVQTLADAA
jgi:hypothetical protein